MKRLLALVMVMAAAACSQQPSNKATAQSPPGQQKTPDESAALAAIAEVNAAQKIYMARNRRYALTYDELREARFLKEEPTVEKTGYDIKLRPAADAGSYAVLAVPSTPSAAARYFFSDQTGVIRTEQGKDANAQSPAIAQ